MNKKKIPIEEAWVKMLEMLRPIKEIRGEQFPKALKNYPELTMSLSTNLGYLRFLIDRIRRRVCAGFDPGIPSNGELDDLICAAAPEDICRFWKGDLEAGKQILERVHDYMDIEVPKPFDFITCEDLINQYREATECFKNISPDLPPAEYIEAVEKCQNQLEEIRQQLVDNGCICDLLFEEYKAATECFDNIPDGLSDSEYFEAVQSCLRQLEDVQSRMNEWGCEY